MKKAVHFFRTHKLVSVLLIIATVLRVSNLTFGFPILYVIPDEVANYQAALTMLATKSFMTISHYPPIGSYVQIPFFILSFVVARLVHPATNFESFQLYLLTHEGALLFVPRLISALTGVASLYVVYRLARELFPKRLYIPFFTLLVLTFSITHIQLSTIGKPIMPAVFLGWLFIHFLFKSTKDTAANRSLLLAIFALTGASSFYFSQLFFLLLYVQIVLFSRNIKQKLLALSFMIVPVIVFFISLSLNTGTNLAHHVDAWHKFLDNVSIGLASVVGTYLTQMILTEPLLTVGFFVGLLFYRRLPPFIKHLALFSVVYLVVFILAYWYSLRYLVPVFLPMALVAVCAGTYLLTSMKMAWRPLVGGVLVFLAIFPGALWFTRYIESPTFITTVGWINAHIPPSTRIGFMQVRFAGYTPARDSIELIQVKSPGAYARVKEVLPTDSYPDNVREVVYLENVVDVRDKKQLVEYMRSHDIRYLVYFYRSPAERFSDPGFVRRFYSTPFIQDAGEESYDLIHWYGMVDELAKVNRFGPYFEVLERVE